MSEENGITSIIDGGKGGIPIKASESVLIARAARWPVKAEMKEKVVKELMAALSMCDSPRDVASVTKALIAIEGQNQADEHLQDKNDRIDGGKPTESIAHRLRVEFDK